MNIMHHLDDATILRYASGDLDEAFAVVVSTHLAFCDACRKAVRDAESAGGQLLEGCAPVSLPADAFDTMFSRLDGAGGNAIRVSKSGASEQRSAARQPGAGWIPLPLARYVGGTIEGINWRNIAPGVRKCDIELASGTGSSLFMLQIGPGRSMPEHGHGGDEMTLVLDGAYSDEFGRFAAGDIADLDEHVEHQPRVDSDGPCTCLVATQTPTRFRSLLMRLLQPIFGI